MKLFEFLAKNKTLYALAGICILLIIAIGRLKGNLEIFDAKFFYLKSEIQPILEAMGEEGRQTYLKVNYVDFAFMIFYTLFFYGMYFTPSRYYSFAVLRRKIRLVATYFCSSTSLLKLSK